MLQETNEEKTARLKEELAIYKHKKRELWRIHRIRIEECEEMIHGIQNAIKWTENENAR